MEPIAEITSAWEHRERGARHGALLDAAISLRSRLIAQGPCISATRRVGPLLPVRRSALVPESCKVGGPYLPCRHNSIEVEFAGGAGPCTVLFAPNLPAGMDNRVSRLLGHRALAPLPSKADLVVFASPPGARMQRRIRERFPQARLLVPPGTQLAPVAAGHHTLVKEALWLGPGIALAPHPHGLSLCLATSHGIWVGSTLAATSDALAPMVSKGLRRFGKKTQSRLLMPRHYGEFAGTYSAMMFAKAVADLCAVSPGLPAFVPVFQLLPSPGFPVANPRFPEDGFAL